MKNLIYRLKGIFAFVIIFTLAGCTTPIEDDNNKLSIVTSIFPQYDFIKEIAKGSDIMLDMLVPAGAESHSFEPTISDIKMIQNCDMFIYIGGESEAWVDTILNSVDLSNIKVVKLMDIIDDKLEEDIEHEGHIHKDVVDEHIWTSPKNAYNIVSYLLQVMKDIDPLNADLYEANTKSYLEEINTLSDDLTNAINNGSRDTIVVGDRFPFSYLARDYHLNYYSAFNSCSADAEASAATLATLIDKVKEDNIPIVFYIEYSDEKMADVICESTGAKKLLLHSCHTVSNKDMADGYNYITLMRQNIEHLKEALG